MSKKMIVLTLPEKIFFPLFQDVALSGLITDGKIWADATPLFPPDYINQAYEASKADHDFDLNGFIHKHFSFTPGGHESFITDPNRSAEEHIAHLWPHLTRTSDEGAEGSSLIALPHPYVVPGGRFNEIYYWDSYFTMVGLKIAGNTTLVRSMVENFAWLIRNTGMIPNGNRSYFLSRSQPPFFSMMVALLSEMDGASCLQHFLPELKKEYAFWMDHEGVDGGIKTLKHVVRMPDGSILNRYWDQLQTPRTEMWAHDIHLAENIHRDTRSFYGDIRAACESGWDFSSRWFGDSRDIRDIVTTDIVPVDLNCLLFHLETTIATALKSAGVGIEAENYQSLANQRKQSILKYLYDESTGYFFDYNFSESRRTSSVHAAGLFPLAFRMLGTTAGMQVLEFTKKHLLAPGGIVTTNIISGQQWDAPNGWAPLQWMAFNAALQYRDRPLATEIAQRWIRLNETVYQRTGKMMEKYNVMDITLESGGGEYPVQDGFGWTNGVYLALKDWLTKNNANAR